MGSYEYYPITGIKEGWGSDGQVPVRRNINEWSSSSDRNDKNQVILYLLALSSFQALPPESRDSYFQIAGIHGFPYCSWDEPEVGQKEIGRKGYCVHANNLFPPWHRPYMLLYEQRLYEIMVNEIIPRYDDKFKDEYLKAARTWRLPFWDWAKDPTTPKLARSRRFRIEFGSGPATVIDNPLYQFRMPNRKTMGVYGVGSVVDFDGGPFLDYGNCYATSRCPAETERDTKGKAWTEGVVHDDEVDKMMSRYSSVTGESYGSAAELVYRLLTYPMDYPHFATLARDEDATSATASTSKVTNDINIEFIHNNIHYWVGGNGGHMSQIPVATFDPTFWLHHCNIDRLFALWQTLHPDEWFETDIQRFFDQKIVGSGTVITNKTPLRPFHKDKKGTVWTPEETRDWFKLGYTYPELSSRHTKPSELLKMVNETYGISRREYLWLVDKSSDLPAGVTALPDGKGVEGYDYALSIQYSKFALGGHPFNIEIFLAPETKNGETTEKFRTEDFVCNVFNFSQPPNNADGEEVCSNCKDGQAQNLQAIAYVPMTSYLLRMVQQQQIDSMDAPVVEEVLKRMYWRFMDIGGAAIPEEKWQSTANLKIKVSKTKVSYKKDPSEKPNFPDPEVIPTLGTSAAEIPAIPPGGVANNLILGNINKLEKAVPAGGSIVFKSSSLNTTRPIKDSGTAIALLYRDPSNQQDERDTENYDILLTMDLRSAKKVMQCNHKLAGRGYGLIKEFTPNPWFGAHPELRVDIQDGQFIISVDGNRLGTYEREIKKPVTHVHYSTKPTRAQPVLANGITATTYQASPP